jgi:hypothetical protein
MRIPLDSPPQPKLDHRGGRRGRAKHLDQTRCSGQVSRIHGSLDRSPERIVGICPYVVANRRQSFRTTPPFVTIHRVFATCRTFFESPWGHSARRRASRRPQGAFEALDPRPVGEGQRARILSRGGCVVIGESWEWASRTRPHQADVRDDVLWRVRGSLRTFIRPLPAPGL